MPRFTVKCSDPGCWWEDDRQYDDLHEAETAIEGECCEVCDDNLYIFDDY